MVKTLRNMYWEAELHKFLKEEAETLHITISELARFIIKQRYKICSLDCCFNKAVYTTEKGYLFCEGHKDTKEYKNNHSGIFLGDSFLH